MRNIKLVAKSSSDGVYLRTVGSHHQSTAGTAKPL